MSQMHRYLLYKTLPVLAFLAVLVAIFILLFGVTS